MREDVHEPVMLGRVVELLSPALAAPGAIYVDCTLENYQDRKSVV